MVWNRATCAQPGEGGRVSGVQRRMSELHNRALRMGPEAPLLPRCRNAVLRVGWGDVCCSAAPPSCISTHRSQSPDISPRHSGHWLQAERPQHAHEGSRGNCGRRRGEAQSPLSATSARSLGPRKCLVAGSPPPPAPASGRPHSNHTGPQPQRTQLESGQEPGRREDVQGGLVEDVEGDVEGVPSSGGRDTLDERRKQL